MKISISKMATSFIPLGSIMKPQLEPTPPPQNLLTADNSEKFKLGLTMVEQSLSPRADH